MFWLSSLPQFRQFRDFSVSTSGPSFEDGTLNIDPDDDMDEGLQRRTRPVRFHPSYTSSYWMWYKGTYMTISRIKEENCWYSGKSTLEITSVCSVYIDCPISESFLQNLFPQSFYPRLPDSRGEAKVGVCKKRQNRHLRRPRVGPISSQ